jgi:hypothetical protein
MASRFILAASDCPCLWCLNISSIIQYTNWKECIVIPYESISIMKDALVDNEVPPGHIL